MEFHIIAVGRLRNPEIRAACENYAVRVRRYARLRIREVPEPKGSTTADGTLRAQRDRLLGVLPPTVRVVALTRQGSAMSSGRFAKQIGRWMEEARDVAFVIGGAFGLHADVLSRSDDRLSLSAMTFPHELSRLVLLEQLYRAHTILHGEPYHKGD
jgi:23S rRNA (pseudouridine1915-N3)-methyltransferase